ncbi:helix-turn-helix domain-containing protein [Bacillus albus]|uniref:helix-turn-helix domain-containing protein n=1 Tax=Bacillus albus TaxID=2026189 RepID=UPI0010221DE6|nr:helix-turn-helix transcriptional regulator [Bacillus albus]
MKDVMTIADLRKLHGLSQIELAEFLGISSRTLQHYERDSSAIPNKVLKKYMDIFEVSYDEIFLGEQYEKIEQRKRRVLKRLSLLKEVS